MAGALAVPRSPTIRSAGNTRLAPRMIDMNHQDHSVRPPVNLLARLSLIAAVGTATLWSGGCTGPTKRGIEQRAIAQKKFDAVRSRVDFDQANQAFESGNFIEAKGHLEAAIDKFDDESAYWVLLGRLYLETGGLQDALKSFREAMELDAKNPDAHYFNAIALERIERPLEAVESYLEALENAPSNSRMLVAAVDVLIGADMLSEAERILQEHRGEFNDDAAVLHLSGRLAMMDGRWTEAADELEKSVLLDDSDRWTLEDLARAQIAAGRTQSCLSTIVRLEAVVEDGDRNAELLRLRGRCLADGNRIREARTTLRDLVNLHPDDVQGWIDFGLVCMAVEDYRHVLRAGQRLAVLAPNRFEGYFLLGHAALRNRDLESAVKLFARSCELAPERDEPQLALGMTHELRGEYGQAYRAYASLARRRPDDAGVQGLLTGVGEALDD